MNERIPILKIELENMQQHFNMAIMSRSKQINEMINASLEAICTVEHIEKIISETALTAMAKVINQEISDFFTYGDGREVISKAVKAMLSKEAKNEP